MWILNTSSIGKNDRLMKLSIFPLSLYQEQYFTIRKDEIMDIY